MARAERLRHPRAGTLVLGLIALAVQAQTQPPAGSPADVRYTATTAGDASLYPLAPGLDAQAPLGLRGEQAGIGYALPGEVSRVVVEVDRNAVPADGQTPVKLVVRLFGADGKPLAKTVLATIEHSGDRVLLPGARTDEFGPRRLDAKAQRQHEAGYHHHHYSLPIGHVYPH